MSSDEEIVAPLLDYDVCRFPGTRLEFRGPAPDFDKPFVATLGGGDVFGRYVERPFPALLSEWLQLPVLNLGVVQAGLSLFTEERWLLDMATRSELTILQVLGAQNMSNRLYSVHSRRNDRFLGVSPALKDMFPDVDFTEINFVGHLMETLSTHSPAAFDVLVEELKWAWVQRMERILSFLEGDVLLLWVCDRRPEDVSREREGRDALFVDRDMLNSLTDRITGLVEVIEPRGDSLDGKIFAPSEREAAKPFLTPAGHARVAEALAERASEILKRPGRSDRSVRAS